jgi:hypothetical protein
VIWEPSQSAVACLFTLGLSRVSEVLQQLSNDTRGQQQGGGHWQRAGARERVSRFEKSLTDKHWVSSQGEGSRWRC